MANPEFLDGKTNPFGFRWALFGIVGFRIIEVSFSKSFIGQSIGIFRSMLWTIPNSLFGLKLTFVEKR